MKICLQCKRLSVDFDFIRGEERCLWKDCNWVNKEKNNYQKTTQKFAHPTRTK